MSSPAPPKNLNQGSANAPLTRQAVTDIICHRLGLSHRQANLILGDILEIMSEHLEAGAAITLSGLGRFETKITPARMGRNPATGKPASIPSQRRPVFTLSRTLRDKIKGQNEVS